jgi:hypothetical protein
MKKTIILSAIFLASFSVYSQLELVEGTDLYVVPGSFLYIASGIHSENASIWNYGTIDLAGSLVNDAGNLFHETSNGTLRFIGITPQEISGNHDIGFHGVTEIDNTAGVALTNSQAGTDQSIYGELKFTNGKLSLNEFNLFIGVTDPCGISPFRYIQTNSTGHVKRNVPADGLTMVSYPVGNSSYNPIILQNSTAAIPDIYSVRIEDTEPAGVSAPHFVNRSWIVSEEEAGGSDITLILQWRAEDEIIPFNRDMCAVGLKTEQSPLYEWDEFGPSTGEGPYSRAGTGFTNTGTFAVADIDALNIPPVAVCNDLTLSADAYCEASVSAEEIGEGSYDPNEDPITYSIDPPGPYNLGETVVTLTVTDDEFAADACNATITVVDDTPPLITTNEVTMEFQIWPPNHKYATFDIIDLVFSVDDNCAALNVEDVYIASASSDEPEDAEGDGDGNTLNDIVIAGDCKSIQLRKERSGEGNGRVYRVHLELDDGNGNIGTANCQVQVPHNYGAKAIDDGTAYEQFGNCGSKSSPIASIENAAVDLLVFPNPFSVNTTITFSTMGGPAIVKVYNSMGIEMEILFDAHAEAGLEYNLVFNGLPHPPGIYLIHFQNGKDVNLVQKVILNK